MAHSQQQLIRQLQHALDAASSPASRIWWERYMKGAIGFRGVGIPSIRSILAEWRLRTGVASQSVEDQFALALELFREPIAEDKLAGILFLQNYLYDRTPWRKALEQYESLYTAGLIADWNTCDWFCVRVLGPTIAAGGAPCARAISKWRQASDVWQARSSVVGFVKVVENAGYHPLIFRSCAVLIRREERFAKTGVGWILRDISKLDAAGVTAFVEANLPFFSPESLNNALKYAAPEKRRRFLMRLKNAQRSQSC